MPTPHVDVMVTPQHSLAAPLLGQVLRRQDSTDVKDGSLHLMIWSQTPTSNKATAAGWLYRQLAAPKP